MKAFEFRDYYEKITIAGNIFDIDTSTDAGDKVRSHTLEEKDVASEIAKGVKTKLDLLAKFKSDIDDVLEVGAFEKIFEQRKPTVSDASDIMLYIVGFMVECNTQRKSERSISDKQEIHIEKDE
ncbi:MAG: hypothetical protein RSG53_08880 [Oscillospiraceae bacterium]